MTSGVISSLIWVITIVILLITALLTTHEPSSRVQCWVQFPGFMGSFGAGRLGAIWVRFKRFSSISDSF